MHRVPVNNVLRMNPSLFFGSPLILTFVFNGSSVVMSLWATWILKDFRMPGMFLYVPFVRYGCCSRRNCVVVCFVSCSRSVSVSSDEVCVLVVL